VIGTALTFVATSWLVVAEWMEARRQALIAKPLASLGFLLVPLLEGTSGTVASRWLVVGLILGAIGDVLLMLSGSAMFVAGLGAFLLGHVAYIIGFVQGEFTALPTILATVAMIAVSVTTMRWLRPHLQPPFDIAVPVYIVVIGVMVVAAVGATDVGLGAKVGAGLFAASDITVARERFVSQNPWNRVIGLPAYYLAQLLIAWSVIASSA
jgi:uncharacterized membrane protein YhhN